MGVEQRVWGRMPAGTAEAIAGLSGSDLQSLLLTVARERAGRVRPAEVVRRWRDDRLVRPSPVDPRRVNAVEGRLWEMLPDGVDGVELSPVVPLGTCAAVGPGSQDRIVSGMRAVEVLSDPTNALAVEAAARRGETAGPVHLAAAHRVLRAQRFRAGLGSHFRLFALVSSGRGTGSGRTGAAMLALHLGYWRRVLAAFTSGGEIGYTVLGDPARWPPIAGAVEEPGQESGRGYYTGLAIRMTAGNVELGAGGFTTWTARLRGDAKEICLTSCVATERLAAT